MLKSIDCSAIDVEVQLETETLIREADLLQTTVSFKHAGRTDWSKTNSHHAHTMYAPFGHITEAPTLDIVTVGMVVIT